jgi:hypothetical protein
MRPWTHAQGVDATPDRRPGGRAVVTVVLHQTISFGEDPPIGESIPLVTLVVMLGLAMAWKQEKEQDGYEPPESEPGRGPERGV